MEIVCNSIIMNIKQRQKKKNKIKLKRKLNTKSGIKIINMPPWDMRQTVANVVPLALFTCQN